MKSHSLKLLSSILIIICLGIGFSSCKKDINKKYEKLIVGKWQITEFKINDKIVNLTDNNFAIEPCDLEGFDLFKTGGEYEKYDNCEKETAKGTWSIKDKKLKANAKVELGELSFDYDIVELTKKKLVLSSMDTEKTEITYKKI